MNNTDTSRMAWPAWLHPAPTSSAAWMRAAGHTPASYAWNLLWSFWVFLGPIFTHVQPGFWWTLAFGYPIFLLIFMLSFVRPAAEVHGYVGVLVLLTAVSIPFNPAAWTYAVFACAMVPYQGSWINSVLKMAVIQALLVIEGSALHWPWYVFLMLIGVCSSTGIGSLAGRINWEKNFRLQMSHDQIRQLAATAERERIGRDLHDLLGHTLSLITLKLELSRKLFDRDVEGARREVEEAEKVARHALAEVRSAVSGIRATDLAAELASARLLLESSRVKLECGTLPVDLPGDVERGLSLVLREAVTNIARHAGASQVRIDMLREQASVCMQIDDNGHGGISADGNGLCGMRERVRDMGGSLVIESSRRGGTHLRVVIPVPFAGRLETARNMPAGSLPVCAGQKYPAA